MEAGRFDMRRFAIISVVVIVIAFLCVATVRMQKGFRRNRERVLRNDLYVMRSVIDQYTLDKKHGPQSLEDLVKAGYLKSIPVDPMTKSDNTWEFDTEPQDLSVGRPYAAIVDVHSASTAKGLDGRPYNTW
jgi:general secretion pathway protein G